MKRFILILFLAALLTPPVSGQSVPPLVNYQGKLSDSNGDPLETGIYSLTFKIWTDAVSTEPSDLVWTQTFDDAQVISGSFNVILGTEGASSIVNAFQGSTRFIEIAVDSGPPIAPRQRILSSPYALAAPGASPIGSIVAWNRDLRDANGDIVGTLILPEGWVECNGQVIDDPESPFDALRVPGLNNESLFLRGGAESGVAQSDEFKAHEHGVGSYSVTSTAQAHHHKWAFVYGDPGTGVGQMQYDPSHHIIVSYPGSEQRYIRTDDVSTSHTHSLGGSSGVAGGAETRPRNMSVVWIIRIK